MLMINTPTIIDPTFGYLVSDVARQLRKTFNHRARRIGLSLAQCRALLYVARQEGLNQARLAELLEVQPITLARLLDRMEAAGWLERRADDSDRRVRRLFLCDKALPLLDQIQDLSAEVRAEALSGLAAADQSVLMTLLKQVHCNLSRQERAEDLPAAFSQDHSDDCAS
ncbi:transcriptional regulator SlyA [mine drainage metagenome]|uniref:Transcriptional regulator SlyA n=1 Tax=mine drainage metagenome TaxID=410659 RepID=A0A1J5RGK7_9ZZZZ